MVLRMRFQCCLIMWFTRIDYWHRPPQYDPVRLFLLIGHDCFYFIHFVTLIKSSSCFEVKAKKFEVVCTHRRDQSCSRWFGAFRKVLTELFNFALESLIVSIFPQCIRRVEKRKLIDEFEVVSNQNFVCNLLVTSLGLSAKSSIQWLRVLCLCAHLLA